MPEFGQYFFGSYSPCQCLCGKSVKKKLEHTSISSCITQPLITKNVCTLNIFLFYKKPTCTKKKIKGGDFVKRNMTYRGIDER